MERMLAPFADRIYALTRIVVGFFFTCHGAQKILGLFGGPHPDMPQGMVWFVGLIELVGGALVAVGLQAGAAAFLCSGLMAGAYFLVHQKEGALPIVNHGELAAVYSWVFLMIASRGSGVWSLDAARGAAPAGDPAA